MRFGSLFAGIGGIDLGLERAGMECVWQVEIDPYCRKVLEKHWPNVRRYKDVKKCGKENLESVDLICGGFPCQPHSVAGKRKGAEDDRNLWPEFSRIIAELRPRYILAENVLGIVTTYLDTVLSDLESQAYTCATLNLPACAFDAPHRRERIFIIAFMDDTESGGRRFRTSENIRETEGKINAFGDTSKICSSDVANADCEHRKKYERGHQLEEETRERPLGRGYQSRGGQWAVEPNVGRVANGVPSRVDRLRCLGNAVVPQVAEWIGKKILKSAERS